MSTSYGLIIELSMFTAGLFIIFFCKIPKYVQA